MIYIARAGSYKDGDEIEIPEDSLGITTEKTVYQGCLCVTWLEPKKESKNYEGDLCGGCGDDCRSCTM